MLTARLDIDSCGSDTDIDNGLANDTGVTDIAGCGDSSR